MSKIDYQVEVFKLAKENDDIQFTEKFAELNEQILKELGYIDEPIEKLLEHIKRKY